MLTRIATDPKAIMRQTVFVDTWAVTARNKGSIGQQKRDIRSHLERIGWVATSWLRDEWGNPVAYAVKAAVAAA